MKKAVVFLFMSVCFTSAAFAQSNEELAIDRSNTEGKILATECLELDQQIEDMRARALAKTLEANSQVIELEANYLSLVEAQQKKCGAGLN